MLEEYDASKPYLIIANAHEFSHNNGNTLEPTAFFNQQARPTSLLLLLLLLLRL